MFISAKEMAKELLSIKSADILCHRSPDGDTTGCAVGLYYGLKQKGIPARIVCADEIPEYLSFMLPKEFDLKSAGETVIAVDIAARGLLGGIESTYSRVDFNIDHHPSNEGFANKTTLVDNAAAAAEVVADVLEEMSVDFTPEIATGLYTALVTDSGSFRYSGTTSRTLRLAAKLLESGANLGLINEKVFESKSRSLIKAEAMAMDGIRYHDVIAVMPITKQIVNESGASWDEMDGLASIPRNIKGVKIAITLKEKDDEISVSLRSNLPYNSSQIASAFGGGGHICAAGCRIKGRNIEDVIEMLMNEAKKQL